MANTVNLDAMIPRADFTEAQENSTPAEQIQTLNLSQLSPDSFLVPSLRKPDFQRETTQWKPAQVTTFLKSFLDNELVPSIILWRSPERLFVIDGAHRISALLAWINDDYGDGVISRKFFDHNITDEQKRIAESLRRKINKEIGSFIDLKAGMSDPSTIKNDETFKTRANNARTRALSLQWVEGDAKKAETSFFKINKQGTPLDKTEERLLRNREKPIAIAARSIIRAGAGHKYWSNFEAETVTEIESLAKELNEYLFSPEISYPVKTLNLPHGGRSSPISAYNLLMDLIAYTSSGNNKPDADCFIYSKDTDGSGTIRALQACIKTMKRITGNHSSSLGLHPAVYFYNSNGRHMDAIFLGIVKAIAKATRDNDKTFFSKFTDRRTIIESIFLKNKSLLNQANSAIYSAKRVDRWAEFLITVINDSERFGTKFSQEDILEALELKGKVIASEVEEIGTNFSDATKSAIFLSQSINQAMQCPICGGFIEVEQSASYDHITAKSNGGKGSLENGQITHPFCNSRKGSS